MDRIIINNVSKTFKIGIRKNISALSRILSLFSDRDTKKKIQVLKNISFTAKEGEVVGIIGKNGSGKSTLLRTIAGIYEKDEGSVKINGRMIPLINLNIGMQERLTMRDNIFLCCSLLGVENRMIKQRFNSIVEFSELKEYVNTKVFQFSEGMKQRLAFAIAIHSNPDILLIDEVFEVGDEKFRTKSSERIKELVKKGTTVLLVSHSLGMIEKYCDRAIWMDNGMVVKIGSSKEVSSSYLKSS